MVLCGQNAGVEEDEDNNEPVEGLRLHGLPTKTSESPVQPEKRPRI